MFKIIQAFALLGGRAGGTDSCVHLVKHGCESFCLGSIFSLDSLFVNLMCFFLLFGVVLQWRQEMGIERMHLVAHSLSAFFAVRYAERHPERLESLVRNLGTAVVVTTAVGEEALQKS